MQDSIIKIENLSYTYSKTKKVLNNINLNIPKGSIYGFLGPNGAGKSTTMQLLTNLLPKQEGEISYFNTPLQEQVPNIFKIIYLVKLKFYNKIDSK
jgi:lantibiotic transport system ATP-binding protein